MKTASFSSRILAGSMALLVGLTQLQPAFAETAKEIAKRAREIRAIDEQIAGKERKKREVEGEIKKIEADMKKAEAAEKASRNTPCNSCPFAGGACSEEDFAKVTGRKTADLKAWWEGEMKRSPASPWATNSCMQFFNKRSWAKGPSLTPSCITQVEQCEAVAAFLDQENLKTRKGDVEAEVKEIEDEIESLRTKRSSTEDCVECNTYGQFPGMREPTTG